MSVFRRILSPQNITGRKNTLRVDKSFQIGLFFHLNICSNVQLIQMPEIADPRCRLEEHTGVRRVMEVSEADLLRASRIFRALGEPSRLRLLALLAKGEACVTEVSEAEGEEISTISQRLRVLRNEGLVSRRRQGKHIVYGLADHHVAELIFNALEHAGEPRQAAMNGRKETARVYVTPNAY